MILLSIIIIAHNQRKELKRCVDSILAQPLPFVHEIIISDDASTDGTWELMQEYQAQYPDRIVVTQCNSDDCNPANNSQRSGWNRCNAYPLAKGKYIAHVDADDYFREGSDVYKRQVEMLEKHPECSLCMSNIIELQDGDSIDKGRMWFDGGTMPTNEQILDSDTYILKDYYILNQAFMMRRNPVVDPVELYGNRYVDAVITYHHLQYGQIVCIDACDYVYVKYKKSISGTITSSDDGWVVYCMALYIPRLIPVWRNNFYRARLWHLYKVVCLALRSHKLTEANARSLKDLNIYIFSAFNRSLSVFDYIRLFCARVYLWILIKCKIKSDFCIGVLDKLLV